MPPRYVYWTILIDGQATAFRAREREELLPTFNQLARKNTNIVMKYFARGRLWDNPEQAQWESRNRPATERRDREWRPGGQHKDPRARFERRSRDEARREGPPSEGGRSRAEARRPANAGEGGAGKPGWVRKPGPSEGGARKPEWAGKAGGAGKPKWARRPERRPRFEERTDKPEQRGPDSPRRERPKWFGKPKWQARPENQGTPESGDRRPDRKFDARDGRPPKRWNRPPKRKPR